MSCGISDLRSGIVLEFDERTGRGLIRDDDGDLLHVSALDILPANAPALIAGVRVVFLKEPLASAPRAIILDVAPGPLDVHARPHLIGAS